MPRKFYFVKFFFRQINRFKVICMDSNQNGVHVKVEIALQRGPGWKIWLVQNKIHSILVRPETLSRKGSEEVLNYLAVFGNCTTKKLKNSYYHNLRILPKEDPAQIDPAVIVDHLFHIFDPDNSGTINFKEFVLATDITSSGSVRPKPLFWFRSETQIRWYFRPIP